MASIVLAVTSALTPVITPPKDWIAGPTPPQHGRWIGIGTWVEPPAEVGVPMAVQTISLMRNDTPGLILQQEAADEVKAINQIGKIVDSHADTACGAPAWFIQLGCKTLTNRQGRNRRPE